MRTLILPAGRLGALVATLALVASAAGAQAEPGRWSVGAMAGGYRFDESSGLKSAPFAGIDAIFQFPMIGATRAARLEPGVGFYAGVAYPTTDFRQFPVVAFDYGDTTFLVGVSQRTRLIEYGAQGALATTLGRLRPYVLGSLGMYAQTIDPRQGGLRSRSKPAFSFGGGLNFVVSRALGFRAEARNVTYTEYERGHLDPTVGYTVDRRIMDELPPPTPAKSTINNLRFALIFSYVPGGATTSADPVNPGGTP